MSWLILGVSLLVAILILGRWLLTADPKTIAQSIRVGAAIALGFLGAYLFIIGRWVLAIPPVLGALSMLGLRNRGRPMPFGLGMRPKPAAPGQSSEIKTKYLIMSLDHDSGAMRGTILEGPFGGRTLDELERHQLLDLCSDWATADPDSAALLGSYLDRRFEDEWREGVEGADSAESERPATSSTAMNREEALDILGLDVNASLADIKAAHRRLIAKIHPDQGGSTYLAAKINQAKDYLLGF